MSATFFSIASAAAFCLISILSQAANIATVTTPSAERETLRFCIANSFDINTTAMFLPLVPLSRSRHRLRTDQPANSHSYSQGHSGDQQRPDRKRGKERQAAGQAEPGHQRPHQSLVRAHLQRAIVRNGVPYQRKG